MVAAPVPAPASATISAQEVPAQDSVPVTVISIIPEAGWRLGMSASEFIRNFMSNTGSCLAGNDYGYGFGSGTGDTYGVFLPRFRFWFR
jgi:hypothetical protein